MGNGVRPIFNYLRVRENLEVKEVTLESGSETRRFVLVRNPQQAARDRAEREGLLERLEAEIEALNARRGAKSEHTRRVCELKSHPGLDLRPLYLRLPERIEAHVLLCWLALLLVRLVETETGQGWERVRDELDQIHRVDLRTKDRALVVVTTPTDEQRKLLKILDIPPPKRVQAIQPTTAAT